MKAKHTPGPWMLKDVENDHKSIRHLVPIDSDGLSLLTVVEHNDATGTSP